jgi:hypothetical protein
MMPVIAAPQKPMSKESERRYLLLMREMSDRLVVANKTITKTVSRYIAERSLMSATCLLVVVAAMHYRLQEPEENDMASMKHSANWAGAKTWT